MKQKKDTLATIWQIDDALWELIQPVLMRYWPRKRTGRPPADWRKVMNGIIYRLRTGCQGNRLPKQFGDDSTVHRWFQRWSQNGVMEQIWAVLVKHCEDLAGVQWKWQAADSALGKARLGGRRGPPPHGSGEKRHEKEPLGRWPGRAAGGDDGPGQLA